MKLKEVIRDYFIFSKSDRNGILFLVCVCLLIILGIFWVNNYSAPIKISDALINTLEERLSNQLDSAENESKLHKNKSIKKTASYTTLNSAINPNELLAEDWMRLGLSEKQTSALLKYKEKIKGFKSIRDLEQAFTLPKEILNRNKPFFIFNPTVNPIATNVARVEKSIAEHENNDKDTQEANHFEVQNQPVTKKETKPLVIEINSTNARTLMKFTCLDSIQASNVIKQRNLLGGFYNINQVLEVEGITNDCYQQLKAMVLVDTLVLRKMNLNFATSRMLSAHPYISNGVASAIVNNRDKSGKFSKIEDLKRCIAVNEELYRKIRPYLMITED
jgi:competence protein ComEA